jgi:hypothetical protein
MTFIYPVFPKAAEFRPTQGLLEAARVVQHGHPFAQEAQDAAGHLTV